MDFNIKKVESQADLVKFIKSQWNFYKNDPNFVPPLVVDRLKMFNKKKNPFFEHSEMEFFLAYQGTDIVGRIAAIKNDNHNFTHNDELGFFGFFECINNQDVANSLFEAAALWLKSKGLNEMRGPINPSQNDEVGLLTEGFDSPPVVLMSYNPPYYIDLIQNAGLVKVKELYAYFLNSGTFATDKLSRLQSAIRERYKVTAREVDFKNKEQFVKDVKTLKDIYNAAWVPNWGFVKMTDAEFDFLTDDLKKIAEPKLTFIVESNGEPAGFALGLPDINQALIYNKNGGIIKGVWHLLTKKKKIDRFRIIVLGVLPKFQKTGIDAVIYYELSKRGSEVGMPNGEASWILEDNEMMNKGLTVTLNSELYKRYRIYQKSI